jgi:serine/threonine-protein phosphatase 2B catalytic subunit
MDAEDNVMASHEDRRAKDQQVDNAIRAIQQKKPLPEIDFTIHTMEDGTQVSTMERVCKGMPRRHTRPPSAGLQPTRLTLPPAP